MPLHLLPLSLQQLLLLEWLSPSAVSAVARSGSTDLRCAVLSSPHPFRAAPREILSDACVRWFHEQCGPRRLVLWSTMKTDNLGVVTYERNGKIHRDDDLPAEIHADGKRVWYQNGEPHRDGDEPACILPCGTRIWCKNGERHRDGDLPAHVRFDGTQTWYQHGELHRDGDEPAGILPCGKQEWYQNGHKIYQSSEKSQ